MHLFFENNEISWSTHTKRISKQHVPVQIIIEKSSPADDAPQQLVDQSMGSEKPADE